MCWSRSPRCTGGSATSGSRRRASSTSTGWAATEALAAIGLTGTTVRLSDRRFLAALAADCGVPEAAQDAFFITVDKLDKIGWDGVRAELLELGFEAAQVAAAEEKIRSLIGV